jgi:branched-chain amino acid transport system substrate-binding protein
MLKLVLHGIAVLGLLAFPVSAAEPIKIGFSSPDTGGSAASGRQFVLTAEIWAEKINNMNGLLGQLPPDRGPVANTTRFLLRVAN